MGGINVEPLDLEAMAAEVPATPEVAPATEPAEELTTPGGE